MCVEYSYLSDSLFLLLCLFGLPGRVVVGSHAAVGWRWRQAVSHARSVVRAVVARVQRLLVLPGRAYIVLHVFFCVTHIGCFVLQLVYMS